MVEDRAVVSNGALAPLPHKVHDVPVVVDVEPPEAEELQRIYAGRVPFCPYGDLEDFLDEGRVLFGRFPERLRRLVYRFAKDGNADGGLLLRGLPRDPELPPTPVTSSASVRKDTHLSEFWMAAFASALGDPVGYAQEKNGAFWQSINPTRSNETKMTSESSQNLLAFHTEVCFHPHMCSHLLLYGLRQDPERLAKTILCGVRRFYRRLPRRLQDLLFEKKFKTGIDPSFGNDQEAAGNGPALSVLYGDRSDPFFRYDLDLMVGLTPAAATALEELRVWVNEYKKELIIEPGSLLIVDNRRAVHARSPFEAHYDGRDRWLERISVVKDLGTSLADRAPERSRIIATDFTEYK
jgi:hypothetical protein